MKLYLLTFSIASVFISTCSSSLAQTAEISIHSTQAIAPNKTGDALLSNPSYKLYFKPGSITADSVIPLVPDELTAVEKSVVLSFDEEAGFPKAQAAIADDGKIMSTPGSFLAPGTKPEGGIGSIKTDSTWLPKVQTKWAAFDKKSRTLQDTSDNTGGVYLVKDRGAGDTVASGKQALVAAPAVAGKSNEFVGGVLFTADTPMGGFGCVLDNQCTSYPGYSVLIAAFDESNVLLYTYQLGVPRGKAVYFGARVKDHTVKSFWVGQLWGMDGTVIDDVAFIPPTK